MAIAFAAIILAGCASQPDSGNAKATIGLQLTPASTLIQVADEKGFFKKNGVDVEIKEFTAGKLALQAMLGNSVDFSTPAEIPVMLAKSQGNELYVITEIGGNINEAPLVVKDDGSETPAMFFGKHRKIATSIGGSPEFSLYMFMKTYGVAKENVEIVAQKPQEMVGTLSSGSVDGMVIFEPYPSIAQQNINGLKIFKLPEGVYQAKYLLAGNKAFVDKNPETTKRIVKALKEAEEFVKTNPEETKTIVAKKTKFDRKMIDKILGDFSFRTGISNELLQDWDREFRWAVDTNKTKATEKPNMQIILREDLLGQA